MSLKEKWVDKVDGVDVNSANDINEVANAVIELEKNSVMSDKLNIEIENALDEAKESGWFNGKDGKSAYAYAQDSGYTGTEAEFAEKLAQPIPEKLPNPNALTINGVAYDGSQPVNVVVDGGGSSGGGTETVLSDNLFDKASIIRNKAFYHSSSGPTTIDSTETVISYVALRGAGTYRTKVSVRTHGEAYAKRVPLLKEDKSFIQNITGTLTATSDNTAYDLEFVVNEDMVAAGAYYYPLTIDNSNIETLMFVKDRDYPSSYIPYGYIEVPVESDNVNDKQDNILRGKTAVFLGDSLCAGTTTLADAKEYGWGWGGLIGDANRMTWKNYGRNGGTITPIASVDEARWVPTQVDLAAADYPEADYVIFEGGGNDADKLGVSGLGTLSPDGYAPTTDSDFTGAFETLVLKILTTFPKAKVGYIVTTKMGVTAAAQNRYRTFYDRAVEICEKWGIPVIDLWRGSPLNPILHYDSTLSADQANEAGKFYIDGQHLTLTGYQAITPSIEAWMRNLYAVGTPTRSEGGTSIDVTAKVGQTIIVKEVDANGKPTKWESAEYQPRTHWTEFEEILPETTIECVEMDIDEDGVGDGLFTGALPDILLAEGSEYNVTYNGVAYPCKFLKVGEDEYETTYAMVNLGAIMGGENTGEPFVLQIIYNKIDDVWYNTIVSFDGSATVTLSIVERVYHTIPQVYLPKTCVVNAQLETDSSTAAFVNGLDTTEIFNAILNDLPIYVNLVVPSSNGGKFSVYRLPANVSGLFGLGNYYPSVKDSFEQAIALGVDISNMQITLFVQIYDQQYSILINHGED